MADRDRRGGARTPAQPAPVSNPGSGARTDGGPGSSRQPIRVASGGRYGERQASVAQQQAAPLPDNSGTPQPVGGGSTQANPAVQTNMPFGPTQRPLEPNTQMPNAAAVNPAAANPQAALHALYAKFPHPAIARLIDWSAYGGNAQP